MVKPFPSPLYDFCIIYFEKKDFSGDAPIYQQIRDQVVAAIASGELRPGERLPTIRALAEECGINMMTVSKAYQLLKAEGYITTGRRDGAVVRLPAGAPDPRTLEGLRLRLPRSRQSPAGTPGTHRRRIPGRGPAGRSLVWRVS